MTYLRTLRRIPGPIILSVATREIVPNDSEACICGWGIREYLARASQRDAADVIPYNEVSTIVEACAEKFGGSQYEWGRLFHGVIDRDAALIEEAFVDRVMEAAGVAVV